MLLVCRAEESDCVSSVRVARVPRVKSFCVSSRRVVPVLCVTNARGSNV